MEKAFVTPLRFACIEGCGLCCSYRVKVEREEIKRIEKLSREKFLRDEGEFMRKQNGYCIFLDKDKKCSIYSERPSQCRTFPFYLERGQIDIDLSCPGVGKGELVEKSFWAELVKYSPASSLTDTSLLTISLPENAEELLPLLSAHSGEEGKDTFSDFFFIENSKGTHFSGKKNLEIYPFSLKHDSVEIKHTTYLLPKVEERYQAEEKDIILSYLSLWSRRKIFRNYVFLTSLLTGSLPDSLALSLLKYLLHLLFSLQEILSQYWEEDSPREDFLKESIRAVDGRLRENCKKVRITIKKGGYL